MIVIKKLIASTLLVIMNAIADMVMQQLQWEKDWLRNVFTFPKFKNFGFVLKSFKANKGAEISMNVRST